MIYSAFNPSKQPEQGKTNDIVTQTNNTSIPQQTIESNVQTIDLTAGIAGEYGREMIMQYNTEFEERQFVYYLPGGKYMVKNIGSYPTQVTVYEAIFHNYETGWDEYTQAGDIVLLKVGESNEINIPNGWFIEIHEPTHIELTPIA